MSGKNVWKARQNTMRILNGDDLLDHVSDLMNRCSSFKELLDAIATNCELRAGYLRCAPYEEHQKAADNWDELAEKIRKVY